MVAKREKDVGRFKVEIELTNYDDMVRARNGDLAADQVRRVKILGVVDSGASHLVLPTSVGKELGLPGVGKVKVTYANRSSAKRDRVESVHLKLMNRESNFTAILEPKRETALIGAIVLEELDFLIDSRNEVLYPRDPKYVTSEAE